MIFSFIYLFVYPLSETHIGEFATSQNVRITVLHTRDNSPEPTGTTSCNDDEDMVSTHFLRVRCSRVNRNHSASCPTPNGMYVIHSDGAKSSANIVYERGATSVRAFMLYHSSIAARGSQGVETRALRDGCSRQTGSPDAVLRIVEARERGQRKKNKNKTKTKIPNKQTRVR